MVSYQECMLTACLLHPEPPGAHCPLARQPSQGCQQQALRLSGIGIHLVLCQASRLNSWPTSMATVIPCIAISLIGATAGPAVQASLLTRTDCTGKLAGTPVMVGGGGEHLLLPGQAGGIS